MLPAQPDGGSGAEGGYEIVGQNSTFRVNPNNTTTPIEQITARSIKYDVTFTWSVTKATYDGAGASALASLKTAQVNQIAGHPHVQGVRGEEDQGNDASLYNFLVVTVGTDDQTRTVDVRIRMDHLGDPGAFTAIDDAWKQMLALGPIVAAA